MIKLIENHKNINYQTLKISNMINKYKIIISINKFFKDYKYLRQKFNIN